MKKSIVLTIFLFYYLTTFAQKKSFEKYFSNQGSFEITDVIEFNNQYLLLCNQSYDTFDQHSSFLLKLNKEGDTVTYYGIDVSFHYVLKSFTNSLSGGLCFVGAIDSFETNFTSSKDGLFIETDYNGIILSNKAIRLNTKSELNNIITDDSSYFVTGNKIINSNNFDLLVANIDSNLNVLDSLSLDFKSNDNITSLSFANNNLLVSGTILGGTNDGYISILNNALDTMFFKKFYLFQDQNNRYIKLWYSYCSKFTSDSLILFPCVFFVRNPIDTNDWSTYEHSGLIITDKYGNLKSIKIYYLNCRNDRPMDIFESNDGNFIIAGTLNFATRRPMPQSLNGDFYLMKVDTLGNIIWFKQYGDINYQEMKNAIKTSDGGFLLSGYSITNYANQERTGYLVKTDANGNLQVGNNQIKFSSTKIYPNPAFDKIIIHSQLKFNTYSITNLIGQNLIEGVVYDNIIDIKELLQGLYILNLKSETDVIQLKFIKE